MIGVYGMQTLNTDQWNGELTSLYFLCIMHWLKVFDS